MVGEWSVWAETLLSAHSSLLEKKGILVMRPVGPFALIREHKMIWILPDCSGFH